MITPAAIRKRLPSVSNENVTHDIRHLVSSLSSHLAEVLPGQYVDFTVPGPINPIVLDGEHVSMGGSWNSSSRSIRAGFFEFLDRMSRRDAQHHRAIRGFHAA